MSKVLIATIVLLRLYFLLLLPATADVVYQNKTQLYQPETQLNSNLAICIRDVSDASFSEVAADGFTWIRIGATWDQIERVKGRYDWTAFDKICQLCRKYHLKPLWLLIYGNTLYGKACSPAGVTAFANFAEACAARSVAKRVAGARYEIWNEPENFGWLGAIYTSKDANILLPLQVAQLNNATVGPIHTADPTARVCTSAYGSLKTEVYWGKSAFAGDPQGNPPVPGMDYNGAFDAVGLHTYNIGQAYNSIEGATVTKINKFPDRNDNPEFLMAYMASDLSADPYPYVTQSIIPISILKKKTYWVTEVGRKFDDDCQSDPDYFAFEWVRTTLCQWIAGIQWQAHYCFDGDTQYNLQGTQAEKAMKFLTSKTLGRSIATMSYPSFSGTLPPANAIWSVTLTGSPTIQIVWVPGQGGSANVPVPPGWTATDMYGNSLNSQITDGTLPMQETSGVYYFTKQDALR